jgi:hypothetical protein
VPEPADGSEALKGLAPSTIAGAYWLSRAVAVSYSYGLVSLGNFSNSYDIEVDSTPPERLLQAPLFQWSGSDSAAGLAAGFSLDFSAIRAESGGTGAIPLQLWEGSYPFLEILLSTQRVTSHELLDSTTFDLFGQTVPLYLQADPSFNLSGSIGSISVTVESWEIA